MSTPEPCATVPGDISAPIFIFGEPASLPLSDVHLRPVPSGSLSLSGPSVTAEPGHLPVRGDLAHIALAGRYFVPHYAVPMPHEIVSEARLRAAAKPEADEICSLPKGASFDVLDIVGGWAWGQYGEDGPVGYLPLASLRAS